MLYPLLGAWTLLWLLLIALIIAAAWAQAHTAQRAPAPEEPDTAAPVPVPREGTAAPTGTRVGEIALPSAAADHDLMFSAVVHWRWAGHVDLTVRNPTGPAVHAVVTRAAEHVRDTDPGDHGRTECALGALLAVEATGTGIAVWAEKVRLRLPEKDAERFALLADLRKDRSLRLAIREAQQDFLLDAPAKTPTEDLVPFDDEDDDEDDDNPFLEPLAEEEVDTTDWTGPGSDVDEDGYESYWWPADEPAPAAAEQDVQVAILRGLVESVREDRRSEFVDQQIHVLEEGGFTEVAQRIRDEFPAR